MLPGWLVRTSTTRIRASGSPFVDDERSGEADMRGMADAGD
jgi:hypothetical protein